MWDVERTVRYAGEDCIALEQALGSWRRAGCCHGPRGSAPGPMVVRGGGINCRARPPADSAMPGGRANAHTTVLHVAECTAPGHRRSCSLHEQCENALWVHCGPGSWVQLCSYRP